MRSKLIFLVTGLILPLTAHAHGEEVIVYPLAALLLGLPLILVADLCRRKAYSYALFFIITQPVIWALCFGIGYMATMLISLFNADDAGLSGIFCGGATLLVMPFYYWRRIITCVVLDALPNNSVKRDAALKRTAPYFRR